MVFHWAEAGSYGWTKGRCMTLVQYKSLMAKAYGAFGPMDQEDLIIYIYFTFFLLT